MASAAAVPDSAAGWPAGSREAGAAAGGLTVGAGAAGAPAAAPPVRLCGLSSRGVSGLPVVVGRGKVKGPRHAPSVHSLW